MPASIDLPPLERCLGVNPIHAANWRPFLNCRGLVAVASSAVATIGPIPRTDARLFCRLDATILRRAVDRPLCGALRNFRLWPISEVHERPVLRRTEGSNGSTCEVGDRRL